MIMCNCNNNQNNWCFEGNLEHLCRVVIINGNVFVVREHKQYLGLFEQHYLGRELPPDINNPNIKSVKTRTSQIYYG